MVCTTPFTGAEVHVAFAIVGLSRQPPAIKFAAGNQLISGRYSSASISNKEEKNFTIRKKENDESRYAIKWSIKTSYPSPLASKNNPPSSPTALASAPSVAASSPAKPQTEPGLPHSKVEDAERAQANLASSASTSSSSTAVLTGSKSWSITVKMFNDTIATWNLVEKGLEAGAWSREPPLELTPFKKFGFIAIPNFAGVVGYAKYRCANAPNTIFLVKWNAPPVAQPRIDAVVNGPQPRTLDSELRLSHSSDNIIAEVTIFAEGSLHGTTTLQKQLQQNKMQQPNLEPSSTPSTDLSRSLPDKNQPSSSSTAPGLLSDAGLAASLGNPMRISPSARSIGSSVSLKVFRLPLEVLVAREARGAKVPWLVESICEWLCQTQVTTRDLFQSGGRYGEIKQMKALIENGSAMAMFEEEGKLIWNDYAPASVVAILKIFLRELPTPLIPPASVSLFMTAEGSDSASSYMDTKVPVISAHATPQIKSSSTAGPSSVRILTSVLRSLPSEHLHTLICICRALRQLWRAPDSVHTLDSISVVLGPLVAPDKPDGSLKSALPVISAFSILLEQLDQVSGSSDQT